MMKPENLINWSQSNDCKLQIKLQLHDHTVFYTSNDTPLKHDHLLYSKRLNLNTAQQQQQQQSLLRFL